MKPFYACLNVSLLSEFNLLKSFVMFCVHLRPGLNGRVIQFIWRTIFKSGVVWERKFKEDPN